MRRVQWLFFAVAATALMLPAMVGVVIWAACSAAAEEAQRIKRDHLS